MRNILENIPDNVAANLLRHEHERLDNRRAILVSEIKARQREIDGIDERLSQVKDGERVLSQHDR